MMDLQWWVTVIEIPIMILMITAISKAYFFARTLTNALWTSHNAFKKDFYNYQIKAAERFVTINHLAEVEQKLTNQLTRIEDKLELIRDKSRGK